MSRRSMAAAFLFLVISIPSRAGTDDSKDDTFDFIGKPAVKTPEAAPPTKQSGPAATAPQQPAPTPETAAPPSPPPPPAPETPPPPTAVSGAPVGDTASQPPIEPPTEAPKQKQQGQPDHKAAAMAAIESGNSQAAQQEVKLALEAHPNDQQLREVEKLLPQHVNTALDQPSLKSRIQGLLTGVQDSGQAPASPILASPIAWGAAPSGPSGAASASSLRELAQKSAASPDFGKHDFAKEGLLKMNLGDYPAAERALTLKILEDPNSWLAYRLRAMARRSLRDRQGAYSDASMALRLNPNDGWSHDVRALTLIDFGRFSEAVNDASQALALNPKDANALVARASAYGHLNHPEESLADLKEAAALDTQFEALYKQALGAQSGPRSLRSTSMTRALYAATGALALVLFALALLQKPHVSKTTSRGAMRSADRMAAGADDRKKNGELPPGYALIRKLGQGGMGVVFEALDEKLERKVAVKKMREEIASDPREHRRFLKEARTVAALKHPNIVEIHSVLERGEELFLVFEYVAGQTLSESLEGGRGLPIERALALARQIGQALDFAHGRGVIHRDLKPSNIMVSEGHVKVMDFGIARRDQQTVSTMSQGEVAGSPPYMAPEQHQGEAVKESDIYSLGLCVYEMLSGVSPFQNAASYFPKVERSYRPISELRPDLPKAVDRALAAALHPDPAQRYHSAGAFLADLEASLKS